MTCILYIDDTESDVELLRVLLGKRNIQLDDARNGEEGIRTYNALKHVAVIIDWNLPDMTGMEVATALRKKNSDCPIAFLSGLFEQEHVQAAYNSGITHCIEKNINMNHIDSLCEYIRVSEASNIKRAI